jgi:hypothetical protein
VGNGRHHFPAAASGQIGKHKVNNSPADIGKGIAIKEEKRSTPMA